MKKEFADPLADCERNNVNLPEAALPADGAGLPPSYEDAVKTSPPVYSFLRQFSLKIFSFQFRHAHSLTFLAEARGE